MGFLQIRQKENSWGKEICFKCDFCGICYVRNYKKRLLITKTGFFCSTTCAGHWKLNNGITYDNLFSKQNRKKAQKKIKATYQENKEEIICKIQNTWQKHWGVDNISKSLKIKQLKKQTTFRNFGVMHHMHDTSIKDKTIQTQLKNRKRWVSKIETLFGEKLCEHYGKKEINPQIKMPCGVIDFYIKPINTFIEFDGVYWHGLNRPKKEIFTSQNPRDKSIKKRMQKDQMVNEWFKTNNLSLCRVTDVQFKTLDFDSIVEKIEKESKGK